MPEVLGIIGIRAGSKGLVNKNIRDLGGRPLVSWIISTALKSKVISRLVVSTDSQSYAKIAQDWGAEIPYLRPSKLAQDESTDFEYVLDMLDYLKNNENYKPDIVVRMLATVPFQKQEDIDGVVQILLRDKEADSSIAVSEARQNPNKAMKMATNKNGDKVLEPYFVTQESSIEPLPRQQMQKAYFRANIVASRVDSVYKYNSLSGQKSLPFLISHNSAIDIDNEFDFWLAEKLLDSEFTDS